MTSGHLPGYPVMTKALRVVPIGAIKVPCVRLVIVIPEIEIRNVITTHMA